MPLDESTSKLRRRMFLRMGGLSSLGLTLPELLRHRQAVGAESRPGAKAKSCILLYMTGGPAQQETFDMKPDAPEALAVSLARSRPACRELKSANCCRNSL